MRFYISITTLCVLMLFNYTKGFGQQEEEVNWNDYVLDTIFRPSADDSTVMDTVIFARKKVVVTKQVVVENEIILDPILTKRSVFVSAGIINNIKSRYSAQIPDYYESYNNTMGFSIDVGFCSDVWKVFTFSLSGGYRYEKEKFHAREIITRNYNFQTTHEEVKEVYYISNPEGTIPVYVKEEVTNNFSNSTSDTLDVSITRKLHSLAFEAAIGRSFREKKVAIIPELHFGYFRMMSCRIKTSSASQIFPNYRISPIEENIFYPGLSITVKYALTKTFGMQLSEKVSFYLKKNTVVTTYNRVGNKLSVGCYLNF